MRSIRAASLLAAIVLTADVSAVEAQAPSAPIASLALHNDRSISVGDCAFSCFDQVYAHSTPAYYSFDTPRSVTLVYNSRTSHPRPIVLLDVQAAAGGVVPTRMSIVAKVSGVTVQPLDGSGPIFYTYADPARPVARMKFQFDATAYATGRYPISVEVTAWNGSTPSPVTTVNGHVLIVNETNSIFGAGWNVAGLQRLYINGNDAVITEGDGSVVHFQRSCPTCPWTAPDGEFSTLTTAGVHVRTYPDGTVIYYDANGLMYYTTYRFLTSTSFTWTFSTAWILSGITDPASKYTQLQYSGGKLQFIIDPGGRTTQFLHSSGNLQRITFVPDGSYEQFGYHTGMWNRLMSSSRSKSGHVTEYGYHLSRQLSIILMPPVAIADSAGTVRPRIDQQPLGAIADPRLYYGYGTSANPAPLVLAAHGGYVVDARRNRTNLGTDRFGAPTIIAPVFPSGGGWGHKTTAIERNQHSQPTRLITPRGDNIQYFWTTSRLDSVFNNRSGQKVRFQYTSAYDDVERIWGDVAEVRNFWSAGNWIAPA